MALPEIMEQHQRAHDGGDTIDALATFAPDATVVDERISELIIAP